MTQNGCHQPWLNVRLAAFVPLVAGCFCYSWKDFHSSESCTALHCHCTATALYCTALPLLCWLYNKYSDMWSSVHWLHQAPPSLTLSTLRPPGNFNKDADCDVTFQNHFRQLREVNVSSEYSLVTVNCSLGHAWRPPTVVLPGSTRGLCNMVWIGNTWPGPSCQVLPGAARCCQVLPGGWSGDEIDLNLANISHSPLHLSRPALVYPV